MMRSYKGSLIFGAVLCVSAASAYAQAPPDIVQSDLSYNTAMGSTADENGGGEANTAVGQAALARSGGVGFNTAVGAFSIWLNGIGDGNSGFGYEALGNNGSGFQNTAAGLQSMVGNTSGYWNTASGVNSLAGNNTGYGNTGAGVMALCGNTTGNENTAIGAFALSGGSFTAPRDLNSCAIATGGDNSALGAYALNANTSGSYNTASGYQSLYSNDTGYRNEASGAWALQFNTTGHDNTAAGQGALLSNTSGSYNIGLGENAGASVTTGNDNIEIGNSGAAADNKIIRIGTPATQLSTYIAGISSAKVTGSAVYVTSSGQLGVLASSERYKTAIASMGPSSEKLQQLRPVTFRLKTDRQGTTQYGLIAEEVAKVYPELVIRNDAGKIEGVRYEELAPMLLNEAQQQQMTIAAQAAEIKDMRQELGELNEFKRSMQAALLNLQAKDK